MFLLDWLSETKGRLKISFETRIMQVILFLNPGGSRKGNKRKSPLRCGQRELKPKKDYNPGRL